MLCRFKKYQLHFKRPGGTSRGVLHDKSTYILTMEEEDRIAYGECNLFEKLSYDDRPDYEEKLKEVCQRLPKERGQLISELGDWPSIRFGVETAMRDFRNGCNHLIFPSVISRAGFTVPINGLIWMGSKEEMLVQIKEKLKEGYTSIKLKIGAIDFEAECALLKFIREQVSSQEVELRLDANGAFAFEEVKEKLKRLADFEIDYIEQPIPAGQWQEMARLVEESPIKIALDEELIGINSLEKKKELMEIIQPDILILKPALIGGFVAADEWKKLIKEAGGQWVITSALESNVGLNAIAQYAALEKTDLAQGLGTGQLFTQNFPSRYTVDAQGIHYHSDMQFDFRSLS